MSEEKRGRGRPKGTAKTGGRAKGTPNRITSDVKGWINNLLDKNAERLERDFLLLSPKERFFVAEKLLQYTTPKMSNTTSTIDLQGISNEQFEELMSIVLKSIENDN